MKQHPSTDSRPPVRKPVVVFIKDQRELETHCQLDEAASAAPSVNVIGVDGRCSPHPSPSSAATEPVTRQRITSKPGEAVDCIISLIWNM